MKKLFIFFLCSLGLWANVLSVKFHKETNGNYLVPLPSLTYEETQGFFLHKTELDLLFTAPREDYRNLNHYAVQYNNHYGYRNTEFFITMSLDCKYIFEGNSLKEDYG